MRILGRIRRSTAFTRLSGHVQNEKSVKHNEDTSYFTTDSRSGLVSQGVGLGYSAYSPEGSDGRFLYSNNSDSLSHGHRASKPWSFPSLPVKSYICRRDDTMRLGILGTMINLGAQLKS